MPLKFILIEVFPGKILFPLPERLIRTAINQPALLSLVRWLANVHEVLLRHLVMYPADIIPTLF